MDENKPSRITSRADKISKKRKVNRIYNILLGIVILAIIVVLVAIFSGNDEENQAIPAEEKSVQQEENTSNNETESNRKTDNSDTDEKDNEEQEEETNTEELTEVESLENATIVNNGNDSNVEKTYENENWQPVGTIQTGEHVTDFTKDATDWNEMKKALAYGAGLDENNIILYWLGNGGAANKATGTISPKDKSATYRVYIEWVDGSGWKPYKVEQLKVNDR